MSAAKAKRTRQSEIALLEKITSSLDTYIKAPDQEQVLRYGDDGNSKLRIASSDSTKDASKNVLATKNLVKSIVKAIVEERARLVKVANEGKSDEELVSEEDVLPNGLVETIVGEYEDNYPSLTVAKVNGALSRYVPPANVKSDDDVPDAKEDKDADEEDEEGDDDEERIVWRCISKVDEEMDQYFSKIAELKKTRETQAAEEEEANKTPKKKRKRKREVKVEDEEGKEGEGGEGAQVEGGDGSERTASGKLKKTRGTYRPRKKKDTPEQKLIDEVAKRYMEEREKNDRLPKGAFESIVLQARQELGLVDAEISNDRVIKRVEYEFHKSKQPPKEPKPRQPRGRQEKDTPEYKLISEIAARFSRERMLLDRIPNGMFEDIVEQTKKDFGMEDFDMDIKKLNRKVSRLRLLYHPDEELDPNDALRGEIDDKYKLEKILFNEVYKRYESEKLASGGKLPFGALESIIEKTKKEFNMPDVDVNKQRVRGRFKRKHPDFENNHSTIPEISKLDDEKKKKRQLLLNEVTARYVAEKEIHQAKLPDGTLDLIIETTKNELGIFDIEVPKDTIRGRLARKSLYVKTLGKTSPYDVIDEPLVQTINNWLGEGISVTRAMGLELANSLLRGKNVTTDEQGEEIVVDAKWWRNFLERNKRRLICSANDKE